MKPNKFMDVAVTIQMPEQIAANLFADDDDLPRRVLEAVAVEGYRAEKLSIGQVAEMLGLTVLETEDFLRARDVELAYALEDFEQDRASLRRILSK
jgi:predicted HTH domain antitoxin